MAFHDAILRASVEGHDDVVFSTFNYRVVDGDIVFRTVAGTSLAAAAGQDPVSFEVDQIDEDISQGWSVLATGRLERIDDPAERLRLREGSVRPWPGEDRNVMLRVVVSDISGRRIWARP